MATLETQYRNYMELNPLSEMTFKEWKSYNSNKLFNSQVRKLFGSNNEINWVELKIDVSINNSINKYSKEYKFLKIK